MEKAKLSEIKPGDKLLFNDGKEKLTVTVKKINLKRGEIDVTWRSGETYLFPSDFTAGNVYKVKTVKKSVVTTGPVVIEYANSIGLKDKYYVHSNLELKGQGITKRSNGENHRRGLKAYHVTEKALEKLKKEYKTAKYVD